MPIGALDADRAGMAVLVQLQPVEQAEIGADNGAANAGVAVIGDDMGVFERFELETTPANGPVEKHVMVLPERKLILAVVIARLVRAIHLAAAWTARTSRAVTKEGWSGRT